MLIAPYKRFLHPPKLSSGLRCLEMVNVICYFCVVVGLCQFLWHWLVPSVRSFSSAHIFHRRLTNIVFMIAKSNYHLIFVFVAAHCSCCCCCPLLSVRCCSGRVLLVSFRSFDLAFFPGRNLRSSIAFPWNDNRKCGKKRSDRTDRSGEWLERLCSCCSPFASQHMDPRVQIMCEACGTVMTALAGYTNTPNTVSTHARSSQIAWRCGFSLSRTGPIHVCVCVDLLDF